VAHAYLDGSATPSALPFVPTDLLKVVRDAGDSRCFAELLRLALILQQTGTICAAGRFGSQLPNLAPHDQLFKKKSD